MPMDSVRTTAVETWMVLPAGLTDEQSVAAALAVDIPLEVFVLVAVERKGDSMAFPFVAASGALHRACAVQDPRVCDVMGSGHRRADQNGIHGHPGVDFLRHWDCEDYYSSHKPRWRNKKERQAKRGNDELMANEGSTANFSSTGSP